MSSPSALASSRMLFVGGGSVVDVVSFATVVVLTAVVAVESLDPPHATTVIANRPARTTIWPLIRIDLILSPSAPYSHSR